MSRTVDALTTTLAPPLPPTPLWANPLPLPSPNQSWRRWLAQLNGEANLIPLGAMTPWLPMPNQLCNGPYNGPIGIPILSVLHFSSPSAQRRKRSGTTP
jgi:hypothetical protein